MPVPVPRISKQPAHQVVKKNPFQSVTSTLPASPPSPPPSFGTREEWINSLPSWRRTKPRRIWEEDSRRVSALPPAGARPGPAVASDGDADDEMSSDYSALDPVRCDDSDSQWSSSSFNMDVDFQSQSQLDISSSPSSDLVIVSADELCDYDRGAFTPVYEDDSPDVASSPIGPVTPFGEYVDRVLQPPMLQEGPLAAPAYDAAAAYVPVAKQDVSVPPPAPEVVTPSANAGYRKLAEPLADWVANYVWKACATGFSLPATFSQAASSIKQRPATAPSYLPSAVHSLLLSTLLQPSAVFLAVWYIARLPVYYDAAPLDAQYAKEQLFRATLLGTDFDRDSSTEATAPFRLIVLGCMLANKWLDDHTFSLLTWHTISNVPIHTLNKLESLALDIFAYDLTVPAADWSQWMAHLLSYHQLISPPSAPGHPQPISRPSTNPHAIVRKALDEIIHAPEACGYDATKPQPVFMGLEERRKERMAQEQTKSVDVLEIDLDEDGPLRDEYLPRRRMSGAGSRATDAPVVRATAENAQAWQARKMLEKALPPPARWSPSADEPILRERNRGSGQYVAVQPPLLSSMIAYPIAPGFPSHTVADGAVYPSAFVAVKPTAVMGYVFDAPPLHVAHPPYSAYPFVAATHTTTAFVSHSRSQSLSYDQDIQHSRNRMRSCSQSFEYHHAGAHMLVTNEMVANADGMDAAWPAPQVHYSYPAPATFVAPSHPAWLRT